MSLLFEKQTNGPHSENAEGAETNASTPFEPLSHEKTQGID